MTYYGTSTAFPQMWKPKKRFISLPQKVPQSHTFWEMLYNYNHALGNHWGDQLLKGGKALGLIKTEKIFKTNCVQMHLTTVIPFSSKYLLLDSNTSCTTNKALNIMQAKSLLDYLVTNVSVHKNPQGSRGLPGFTAFVMAR